MKKVLMISALTLGLTFSSLNKGVCCSYGPSGEFAAAVLSLNLVGNPFVNITGGAQAVWNSIFGTSLQESMSAAFVGSPFYASMESGMVPLGGKLLSQGPTGLQNEFAALNTTALGLDRQVASGSAKTWVSLTASELNSLKTDASLAGMAGF